MEYALEIAGVGLTAFASTNLDNLLLLTLLFGQRQQSTLAVFLGYVGSIVVVVLVGFVAAGLAHSLPPNMLGYLGLVPLAMGLYRLRQLLERRGADNEGSQSATTLGIAGVAALTLANCADTFAVLLPLFAETAETLIYVLSGTIIAAAMIWVALSRWMSSHPSVRLLLARAERWLIPILLILVGLYILFNSPSDSLPGESF